MPSFISLPLSDEVCTLNPRSGSPLIYPLPLSDKFCILNPISERSSYHIYPPTLIRWLFVRIHAYIHTEQYYGKRVEKHLLFFTIVSTKTCYLAFSVILFWLTAKMFHIGSFLEYGILWSRDEEEVYLNVVSLIL